MLGVLWTVGCVGQWEADPCPKLRFLTQSNSQARGMDCITSAVGHAQQGFCCCCSVPKSYPTLCSPVNCSMLGFPVLHHLLEFAQTHVHWVGDAIQPSHPQLPPSHPALSLSQHHGLFQWVSASHQMGKVLELQFQNQSFQWIFRVDFL